MFYDEPPSREILREWLARNDIHVHPALEIVDMDEGTGWMVESAARIPEGELLLSAPKTAVLSPRNSSLYPLLPPALTHPPSSSDNTSIPAATNHALLVFALCILHELRLGKGSRWYGYLQSLPRPAEIAGLLPVFWDLAGDSERTDPADGEVGEQERDMQEGYAWLKGTDAWGDLMRRQREGMGLDDIHSFWRATASSLPPTPIHPSAPSFSSFTYAYTLLSTRAFIIDIYHHTALVPFADIFNHSSFPHTSLASDEFVCHLCGSMALCVHDAVDNDRVPARMGHVHPQSRRKLLDGQEKDTIEMRADREIGKRVEVGNTYGEDMGDGRLLVEYGFIGEEYAGEGIRLEVPFHQEEGVRARAYEVMRLIEEDERREVAGGRTEDPSNAFAALSMDDSGAARSRGGNGNTGTAQGTEDDDSLFYHPKSFRMPPSHTVSHANDTTYSPTGQDEGGWYLSHAGQVSYPLLCLIAVSQLESQAGSSSVEVARAPGQLVKRIRQAVRGLERVYETVRHDEDDDVDEREDESTTLETGSLPAKDDHSGRFSGDEAKGTHSHMLVLARAIRSILQDRLASMYKADIPLTDLFEQRDALAEDRPRTRLAMTLSINERVLLITAAHKWAEVLRVLQG